MQRIDKKIIDRIYKLRKKRNEKGKPMSTYQIAKDPKVNTSHNTVAIYLRMRRDLTE